MCVHGHVKHLSQQVTVEFTTFISGCLSGALEFQDLLSGNRESLDVLFQMLVKIKWKKENKKAAAAPMQHTTIAD